MTEFTGQRVEAWIQIENESEWHERPGEMFGLSEMALSVAER
jgi:hypothetical protein